MHRYTGPFKFDDPNSKYITYRMATPIEPNTIIVSADGFLAVVTNCEPDIWSVGPGYIITMRPYKGYKPSFLRRVWYRITTWIKKLFNRKKA